MLGNKLCKLVINAGLTALAGAALLAGCRAEAGEPDPAAHWKLVGDETMRAETQPRAIDRILLAQTITGAGEDAMLYNHHFDGPELNSLGQTKLRLMLEDLQFLADPHVYVVSGEAQHMAAVRRYLADWGLALDDARLHAGLNPSAGRSAALGTLDRQKFEGTDVQPTEGGSGTATSR
jgi:hypothetical protein